MAIIPQPELQKLITDPDGAETLVKWTDTLGKKLNDDGLNTTQIRALFGEVRQIQAKWGLGGQHRPQALRRLILLKPKLAYRARKDKAVEALADELKPAVDLVIKEENKERQDEHFQRFVEFFEAILAYHKFYGGN